MTKNGRFGMLRKVRNIEASMHRWEAALRLAGVGFFVGSSIVLGVLGGRWLDNRLNTEPVLLIVGLLGGVIVAFFGVHRMLLPLMGKKRNKENG